MYYATKRSYDPVDYVSNYKIEFWSMEKEGEGELVFYELEDKLLEEYPKDSKELNHGMILNFILKYNFLTNVYIIFFKGDEDK